MKTSYKRVLDIEEMLKNAEKEISQGNRDAALRDLPSILEDCLILALKSQGVFISSDLDSLYKKSMALLDACTLSEKEKEIIIKSVDECDYSGKINPETGRYVFSEDIIVTEVQVVVWQAYFVLRRFIEQVVCLNKKEILDRQKQSDSYLPNYYYNKNHRITMGAFLGCKTEEDLDSNSTYMNCLEKAKQGDYEAMLDLAVGFIGNKTNYTSHQLVYYRNSTSVINGDYYYWILKACEQVIEDDKNNKHKDNYFIATALLEAIKFEYFVTCCAAN